MLNFHQAICPIASPAKMRMQGKKSHDCNWSYLPRWPMISLSYHRDICIIIAQQQSYSIWTYSDKYRNVLGLLEEPKSLDDPAAVNDAKNLYMACANEGKSMGRFSCAMIV